LADPRRVVQARGQLRTCQQVQGFNWDDSKLRSARAVSMKDRRVTVPDEATRAHFMPPYAALMLTASSLAEAAGAAPEPKRQLRGKLFTTTKVSNGSMAACH
jgi:hypothetical protein